MISYRLDDLGDSWAGSVVVDEFQQKLPFYVYNLGFYHMGEKYFTKRDNMNNYLLIFTTEGMGRMSWNGGNCILEPGSAVLIDCNIYQEYGTMKGCQWKFFYVHLGAISLEGFRNILLEKLTPVMLRSSESVRNNMEKMCRISSQEGVAGSIMMSNFLSDTLTEMVCSLAENKKEDTALNRSDISRLAEYIRTNCKEELHIEDFCKFTNLSRHYLIRVFERQMGMPPYRYLHLCRVNQAQILLRTTYWSMAEIAEQVGYGSEAVFIRHFRSLTGMTPGIYRRESIRM